MRRPSRSTLASYRGLLDQLAHAGDLASDPTRSETRADDVSHWDVRQHLDHLLITDSKILEALHKGLAGEMQDEPDGKPKMMGRIILRTGFIPRGRARAPEFVNPTDRSPSEIADALAETRDGYLAIEPRLGEIESFRATQSHPILGHFTAVQWLRFAHLHHRHHDKIIDDILQAAG